MNQGGPPLLGGRVPIPPTLEPAAFAAAIAVGTQVVDARDAADHVAGHIPGSISIPLDESFGTWLGWVVDLDRPVALVVARPRRRRAAHAPGDPDRPRRGRRGTSGGLDAWRAAGHPVEASGRRSRSTSLARDLGRAARPSARCSSTSARRPSTRPATSRAPGTSTPARWPTASPSCRATGPSRRCAPPASGRRSRRRSCAPPASPTCRLGRERVPGLGRRRLSGRIGWPEVTRTRTRGARTGTGSDRTATERPDGRTVRTGDPGPRADPWSEVADATMPA